MHERTALLIAIVALLFVQSSYGQAYRPDNVYEGAEASMQLNSFLEAADKAGLADALKETNFSGTVFAPNDMAFATALKDLNTTLDELAEGGALEDLLLFHIVPGKSLFPKAALRPGAELETLKGPPLLVDRTVPGLIHIYGGPKLTQPLNFATVLQFQRLKGNNAVVYVVDRVLAPPVEDEPEQP